MKTPNAGQESMGEGCQQVCARACVNVGQEFFLLREHISPRLLVGCLIGFTLASISPRSLYQDLSLLAVSAGAFRPLKHEHCNETFKDVHHIMPPKSGCFLI